jgi:hypothetical protein
LRSRIRARRARTCDVTFNDLAAATFVDIVAATVDFLRHDAQVTNGVHEDRELILVAAPAILRPALDERLRAWWTDQLQEAAYT